MGSYFTGLFAFVKTSTSSTSSGPDFAVVLIIIGVVLAIVYLLKLFYKVINRQGGSQDKSSAKQTSWGFDDRAELRAELRERTSKEKVDDILEKIDAGIPVSDQDIRELGYWFSPVDLNQRSSTGSEEGETVTDAALRNADLLDRLAEILYSKFSDYTIKEFVDVNNQGDNTAYIDFVLEKEDKPKLAILISQRHKYKHASTLAVKYACHEQGMELLVFYTELINMPEYIIARIKNGLNRVNSAEKENAG
jgi:hypothetical protein